VNALTAAAGDTFDASLADSSIPVTKTATLPGTCTEGQHHQDTDSLGSETYVCTATNTWKKLQAQLPIYDVRDYGVTCDGTTDDTAAIAAAMAAMTDGGILQFPSSAGGCIFTTIDVSAATGHGIRLRGACDADNNNCTNLRCNNPSGTCIKAGTDGMISDFTLKTKSGVTNTLSNIYIDGRASRSSIDNLLYVTNCGTCLINGGLVSNITGMVPVEGGIGVHMIDSISMFYNFVIVNTQHATSIGWKIEQVTGQPDTNVIHNSGSDGPGTGLWILSADPDKAPRWLSFIGFGSETGTTVPGVRIENCRDCSFIESYILGGTNNVKITGGKGIQFIGGLMFGAQLDSVYHSGDSDTEFTNVNVVDGGQSLTDCSGTKYSAVHLTATSKHFRMNGGQLGDGFYFPAGKSCIGATCINGADQYSFRNIRCDSNTTACHDSCSGPATPGAVSDRLDFMPLTSGRIGSDGNINVCYDADSTSTTEGVNFVTNASCGTTIAGATDNGLFVNSALATRFYDADDSNYIAVKAPSVSAANFTATLPAETGTICTTGSICSGTVTYQAGPLTGDVVTVGAAATIQVNSVELGTDTTGNYAAGDAEAGAALTGDTATSFFATGELERTLLPAASADCAASNWAKGIDADLVLDCAQPNFTDLAGTATAAQIPLAVLLAGRSGGQTIIGGTASGDDLTLQSTSNATKGTLFLDDAVELWPSMPDQSTGSVAMMSFASTTHDVTGGTFKVLSIAPTTAHGSGASQLIRMNPTYTFGTGGGIPIIEALRVDGTWTNNAAADPFPTINLFATSIVFDATAAGREPLNAMVLLGHGNTYRYSATSGTGSGGSVTVLDDNAIWTTTGNGGTWTSGDAYGLRSRMSVTSETGGTVTVPNRYGFSFADAVLSGAGTETLTSQVAVDIAALSSATTNIGIRNADTTVFTPPTTVTVGAAFSLTATATTQKLDAAAARTSDTTTAIVDGVSDGQLFVIINVDTTPDIITIDDGGNTDLGGANCALNSGGTLTVMWVAVLSNWVKISCSPN